MYKLVFVFTLLGCVVCLSFRDDSETNATATLESLAKAIEVITAELRELKEALLVTKTTTTMLTTTTTTTSATPLRPLAIVLKSIGTVALINHFITNPANYFIYIALKKLLKKYQSS